MTELKNEYNEFKPTSVYNITEKKNIKDLNIREEQHKKLENTDISIDIINKI